MTRIGLLCALACACGNDGSASYADPLDDPQLPPRGYDDVFTWLEAGHYKTWACEDTPHDPRPPSAHKRNRICSNAALASADGTGAFPVGAAAVKELFDGSGTLVQYAVSRRVDDGPDGDSWYWLEGSRDDVPFNGEGEGTCTGCHARAPRDFVFTVVID